MTRARAQQRAADRAQLEKEVHLVKAPGALLREQQVQLVPSRTKIDFEETLCNSRFCM